MRRRASADRSVRLPWRVSLRLREADALSNAIWRSGVYDLALSEALWRLCDPKESVCDVGAHVGYTTSILFARVGEGGMVVALEPHPELFAILASTVREWTDNPGAATVEAICAAVGDAAREGVLCVPREFKDNAGLSYLQSLQAGPRAHVDPSGEQLRVQVVDLDTFYAGRRPPALLKLDAEGGEFDILRGARRLLEGHAVRDVVFEDGTGSNGRSILMLRELGFAVFRIERTFFGPRLEPLAHSQGVRGHPWEPPNWLATRAADRARVRFRARGWSLLRGR